MGGGGARGLRGTGLTEMNHNFYPTSIVFVWTQYLSHNHTILVKNTNTILVKKHNTCQEHKQRHIHRLEKGWSSLQ